MRDIIQTGKLGTQSIVWLGFGAVLAVVLGVSYLSMPSTDGKSANKSDVANLGKAPSSDAYTQSYQSKLEQKIDKRFQDIDKANQQQQTAWQELQSASMKRQEESIKNAMEQFKQMQMAGAAGQPNALSDSPTYKPTKVYTMGAQGDGEEDKPNFLGTPSDLRNGNVAEDVASGVHSQKKSTDAFIIPPGGWIKGRLINGVIGGQGEDFRYTSIKLTGSYQGPNNYSQNLDGCVIVGEASANLSQRRFIVKPIKLTCTLPTGRNKTWDTSGYVVDAKDGIQGINGTLINNEGNKLSASMMAGAIESAGSYYNQSAVNSSVSTLTGTVTGTVTNPGKYLAGGIVQGAGKGLKENIQDYYELFKSTLQVGGGGEVTVHLLSALDLPDGGNAISTIKAAR